MSTEYDIYFPEKEISLVGGGKVKMRPLPITHFSKLAETFSSVFVVIIQASMQAVLVEKEVTEPVLNEAGQPMVDAEGVVITQTIAGQEPIIPLDAVSNAVDSLVKDKLDVILDLVGACLPEGVEIKRLPSTAIFDLLAAFVELNLSEEVLSRFLLLLDRMKMTYTTIQMLVSPPPN